MCTVPAGSDEPVLWSALSKAAVPFSPCLPLSYQFQRQFEKRMCLLEVEKMPVA